MAKTRIFPVRLQDFAPEDGGGINLDIASGKVRDDSTLTEKAAQTVALTDDATNFVEISGAGVASANTSSFTSGSIAIAEVVTASGSITSISDKRTWIATRSTSAVNVIDDLTDVDTTTNAPATGDRLRFDGTNWVPDDPTTFTLNNGTDISTSSTTFVNMSGTDVTVTIGAGQFIKYDASVGHRRASGGGIGSIAFRTRRDTTTITPGNLWIGRQDTVDDGTANVTYSQSITDTTAPGAGTYTLRLQWQVRSGTGSVASLNRVIHVTVI